MILFWENINDKYIVYLPVLLFFFVFLIPKLGWLRCNNMHDETMEWWFHSCIRYTGASFSKTWNSLQPAFSMETNALFYMFCWIERWGEINALIFQWHGYMSYGVIQQTDNSHNLSLQLTLIFFFLRLKVRRTYCLRGVR